MSSAFHATRLALPGMLAKNWGRIINVASVHGLVGSSEKSAYVAAKHGVVGLTKVVALENYPGLASPATPSAPAGYSRPWFKSRWMPKVAQGISNADATKQLLGEKEPSMQFTTPEELGALAVFFARPPAITCAEHGRRLGRVRLFWAISSPIGLGPR